MPNTTTVTSKGQTTIPKRIRDRLNLKAGDRVEFVVEEDGKVVLVPATVRITELKRILPRPKIPVSLDAMEAAIKLGAAAKLKNRE